MMTFIILMSGAVLLWGQEKFNIRSLLGEVYFVIHKYTDLDIDRTLSEYVF
jgi:hypothetical protein